MRTDARGLNNLILAVRKVSTSRQSQNSLQRVIASGNDDASPHSSSPRCCSVASHLQALVSYSTPTIASHTQRKLPNDVLSGEFQPAAIASFAFVRLVNLTLAFFSPFQSNNNNNNNPDNKKEEFRKYLEKTGVIDALTKVLVGLYEEPERPSNAVDYIKRYIGAPQNVDVDSLKKENEQLKAQMDKLTRQIEEFKRM